MSEKLKELISLLYQDNLTQYGKRLLVENIEKLQKENKKLQEENEELNTRLQEAINEKYELKTELYLNSMPKSKIKGLLREVQDYDLSYKDEILFKLLQKLLKSEE